mmetsp:Transcript_30424/g.87218  ORF Transcript_30424/g.87218 Transcript_30424/m.87218 type:complete len:664 (+) Transcript_30424:36-2027(+)
MDVPVLGLKAFTRDFDAHFEINSHGIGSALQGICSSDAEAEKRCEPLPRLKTQPRGWGIRVRTLQTFFEYIQNDLEGYAATHHLDEDWCDVCLVSPCCWQHHGKHVTFETARGKLRPMTPNMKLVVERYIKPWTQDFQDAGMALALNAGHLVGRPGRTAEGICMASIFISHCWNEPFPDFAQTVYGALDLDTTIWVCSFAIWQHGNIAAELHDLKACPFAEAMVDSDRVLVVTDDSAEVFDRCWCVLEAKLAQEFGKPYDIALSRDKDENLWLQVNKKLESLDVRSCHATVESDKTAILEYIARLPGGIGATNQEIRDASHHAVTRVKRVAEAVRGDVVALLSAGTEELLSWRSIRSRTVIHILARHQHVAAMIRILQVMNNAHLNALDQELQTPISVAAEHGAPGSVEILLARRADMELPDNCGLTALHLAAANGHSSCIGVLVAARANLEAVGTYRSAPGYRALHVACREGWRAATRALVASKACLTSSVLGLNSLHLAAREAHPAVVGVLVSAKAEPNAVTEQERTSALMFAVQSGDVASVGLLLAMKADLNARDYHGHTCFDYYAGALARGGDADTMEGILDLLKKHQMPTSRSSPGGDEIKKLFVEHDRTRSGLIHQSVLKRLTELGDSDFDRLLSLVSGVSAEYVPYERFLEVVWQT